MSQVDESSSLSSTGCGLGSLPPPSLLTCVTVTSSVYQTVVKLCVISYSVCPRNRILLSIYTAVCYLIVKSDLRSLVPDIPIPFQGIPSACIR